MKRWLPLLILLLLLGLVLSQGWQHQITWATLAANQARLAEAVATSPLLAGLAFMAVYAGAVSLAIPGAGALSVAGGFLFGTLTASVLVSLATTSGAIVLFLAARTALAELLARRFAVVMQRIGPGLRRDGFSYLLALRLVSVVPFAVGNLGAAMVGMRLAPFIAATFLGVLPSTVVLTSVGAGLSGVLRAGQEPGLALILNPGVLLPLLGLALLALAPVAWRLARRRWKGETDQRSSPTA